MTLGDVIRKVTHWRDNLQANAAHLRANGSEAAARHVDTRARDMEDILEMLGQVDNA